MKNILEIDSVQFGWDESLILSNVYLGSETGRVTGVLGRNGCGKSTLFKLIFGDISTNHKSVRINGNVLSGNYRNPAELRMLPQFNFVPKYLKIKGLFESFNLSYSEFCDVFEDFSLSENYRIGQLSGGNIRIVEIYLILMSNTKFCILDEPFSHLSPKQVGIFLDLIVQEKEKKGIIISDHMYKYVLDLSDDLYLISDGTSYKIDDANELVDYRYLNG